MRNGRNTFFNQPDVYGAQIYHTDEHKEYVVVTVMHGVPPIFGKYLELKITKSDSVPVPQVGNHIVVIDYQHKQPDYVLLPPNQLATEIDVDAVFRGKSTSP